MLYCRLAVLLSLTWCLTAEADQPSRAWDFDLSTPGSYKVQVEHDGRGIVPDGTKVTYTFTVGNETRSQDHPLIADQAFIGLTLGTGHPEKMHLVISGLPQSALKRTKVYVYDATSTLADEKSFTYEEAKAIWTGKMSSVEYQTYASEFSQFNNHFGLDTKNGCYGLATGPVNLMLIITHPKNEEYAVVERVLADVDNAKSRCFQKTYSGIRTKVPPFLPFVMQLGMA